MVYERKLHHRVFKETPDSWDLFLLQILIQKFWDGSRVLIFKVKTSLRQFKSTHGCCCSVAKLCPALWDSMNCSLPSFPVFHHLPEFAQTHDHWVSNIIQHLVLSLPLLLHSIFPSIRVFSSESAFCIRWPKYWSFSFSTPVLPMNIELISFRIDWFDIPAVQGTLKRLLQHHSSKVSILQHSVFFISFYWNV